jgi:hypothetical protein
LHQWLGMCGVAFGLVKPVAGVRCPRQQQGGDQGTGGGAVLVHTLHCSHDLSNP